MSYKIRRFRERIVITEEIYDKDQEKDQEYKINIIFVVESFMIRSLGSKLKIGLLDLNRKSRKECKRKRSRNEYLMALVTKGW